MNKFLSLIAIILLTFVAASAQTETASKRDSKVKYKRAVPGQKVAAVINLGPPTTYLKEGLSTELVVRLLGRPETVAQRVNSEGRAVTAYEFTRGAGRVLVAEFVNGALVGTRVEPRSQQVRLD